MNVGMNENRCRMCGVVTMSGVSLLDPEYRTLAQSVGFNFKYKVEDGTRICPPCVDNLQSSLKFIQNCEQTRNNCNKLIQWSVNLPDLVKSEVTEPQENILCEETEFDNRLPHHVEVNEILKFEDSFEVNDSLKFEIPGEVNDCLKIETEVIEPLMFVDIVEVNQTLKFKDPNEVDADPLDIKDSFLSGSDMNIASELPKLNVASVREARLIHSAPQETRIHTHSQRQTDGGADFEENLSDPPEQCSYCEEKFRRPLDYIEHLLVKHKLLKKQILRLIPKVSYQCTKCTRKFPSEYSMEKHLKNSHGPTLFTCKICGRSEKTQNRFDNHMMTHNKEPDVQCPHCDNKYTNNKNLARHIQTVHVEGNDIFPCQICPSTFKVKRYLQRHVIMVHSQKKWPCHTCSYVAKAKKYLKKHIKGQHSSKKLICDFCGYKCSVKWVLRSHILTVHIITSKDIKCEKCSSKFKTKTHLNYHVRAMHSDIEVPIFQCDLCERQFKFNTKLREHKKNVHGGCKYPCEHCHVTCKSKDSLRKHVALKHRGIVKKIV